MRKSNCGPHLACQPFATWVAAPSPALSGVLVSRISSGPMSGSHGVSEGLFSGSRVSDACFGATVTRGFLLDGRRKCLFTRSVLNILLFYREALVCHFLCELAVQVSS